MKNKNSKPGLCALLFACTIFIKSISAIGQPVVTAVTPQKASPGTTITITGSGFNTTAANNKVYFGATKGSVTSSTATSVSVTVPVGARYDAVSVNNTVLALTGYSVYPFLPTFNNSAYLPGNINFNPSSAFFSMSRANAVAIGDVDGDGKPDVVVTDDAHTVSVFRNTSISGAITPGSFAPKVDFTTGANPSSVLLKDIDGDTKPDIIITNADAGTISVLRNTASLGSITTGSFAAKVDFIVGSVPTSMAISDINGDGKPDLIVTNSSTNTVSVLQNNSIVGAITTGSFLAKVDFVTGLGPRVLSMSDIDGDGKADIVIATGDVVSILLNTHTSGAISSGSFAAKVDYITSPWSYYMAVSDIDGDGKPDIVTGSLDLDVSVYHNTAVSGTIDAGSLASPTHFVLDGIVTHMADMAIADVNGDGKPDIVYVSDNNADQVNHVAVMRNTSVPGPITSGSFATNVNFNLEIDFTENARLCIGDIDGDSKPDIVLTDMDMNTVNVLRNSPQPLSPVPAPVVSGITPNVGIPGSSVTIAGSNFNAIPANNAVYFGGTKATVTSATSTSLNVQVPVGATYLPVSVNNAATNLSGYSRAPFLPSFSDCAALQSILAFDNGLLIGTVVRAVAVGDLNGDGKDEVVYAVSDFPFNHIYIFQNTGTSGSISSSSFSAPIDIHTLGIPNVLKIADMDGDGKPDLVYTNDLELSGTFPYAVGVIRNRSAGGTITSSSFDDEVNSYFDLDATTYAAANDFSLGDIDGDGKPDVIIANREGFSVLRNNFVTGYATPGAFSDPVSFLSGANTASSCTVADIDGDGKVDVVVGYYGANSFNIFKNTASLGPITSGSFAAPVSFATPAGNALVKTADIDRDGKPDILTVNLTANNVSVFQNTATSGSITGGSFAARVDITTPASPKSVFVADMDGGGTADLVVSNTGTSSIFRNTAISGGTITSATFAPLANFTTGGVYEIADLDGDNKPDLITNNGAFDLVVVRNNRMCGTAITGSLGLCPAGGTTTLGNINPGGTWTSGNTAVATVGSSSGIVTGVVTGTAVISYAFPPGAYNTISGFTATAIVTVQNLPVAGTVTGTANLCAGTTTTLSASETSGAWSSDATSIATVNSAGTVTGIAPGTATISYATTNGCGTVAATLIVTVNALPIAGTITGASTVCVSATTTLGDVASGGSWSSGSTGIATVGSGSGVVTGMATGAAVISYIVANGCGVAFTTKSVTVNPLPFAGTVTGGASVCEASTISLADVAPGGVWISGTTAVATVNSLGVVTGVAAGTSEISYAVINSCGSDVAVKVVTVNPLPVGGTITGATAVCPTVMTPLTDAATGGTWTSGATVIATVGGTGIVTGISAGTAVISYSVTNGCGTAIATHVMTVNPLPDAGFITGTPAACVDATTTLSDIAPDGIWSSSIPVIATIGTTGIVSGIIAGTATISYSVSNSCGTDVATVEVTVNPLADAGTITGTTTVCEGSTTALGDAVTDGTWNSGMASIASISTAGIVTGITPGTAVISYTYTNMCGTATSTVNVTVNPLANAGVITGTGIVCEGSTTALAATVTGGTWESGSTGQATVGATGIVTGISTGTATISYSVTNTCNTDVTTKIVTINPLPHAAAITGTDSVCVADSVHLADAVSGGTWSSSSPVVAVVTSAGTVLGLSAGTAIISYHVTNSCGIDHAVLSVHVRSVAECTTGVDPMPGNVQKELSVYPNPTNSGFTIRSGEAGTFGLYTLEGRELTKYTIVNGINSFSMPKGIAAGIYMGRFEGQDGNVVLVRLVYEP